MSRLKTADSRCERGLKLRLPIIAIAGYDVMIFPDLAHAEGWLEDYDIDDYVAFDSDARKLVLLPGPYHSVNAQEANDDEFHEDELKRLLVRSLSARDVLPQNGATLAELLLLAEPYFLRPGTRSVDVFGRFGARVGRLWARLGLRRPSD